MRISSYAFAAALLGSSLILQGCIESSVLADAQRPDHWGLAIAKKHNFYQVNSWLYRSEQPSDLLLPYLQQQKIDIVINLRTRNEDLTLLKHQNIQLIHIPINTWDIRQQQIVKVMQILQKAQAAHQRVLIHCYHGSDRTGTMVAMSRILLENWSSDDAINEMKHGGYGFHPIWMNIDGLFKTKNIDWMRQQLAHPTQ